MASYQITPVQVGSLWLYRGAFASKADQYRTQEEFPGPGSRHSGASLREPAYSMMDGIRLIPLPGHTSGLQGVLVHTEEGRVLIASDAVPLYECVEGLEHGESAISSLFTDLKAFYGTYDRLRNLQKAGVHSLASHDFLTLTSCPPERAKK